MIKRLGFLPAFLVAAIASTAAAQAKRPMKVDDLLGAVRVGDPQLSPDGRTVLFVRTTTDIGTGKRNSDIWLVPADGSAQPRAWIESPAGDDTPRFLPDGRVVFVSSRDGTSQVYLADSSGRDVKPLTKVGAGVQAPLVVSPDGRMVAYVADVAPACADEVCNARVRDSIAKDPVKVHRLTRLPFRHWSDWWESQRHHVYVTDVATGATRDVTPGDFDSPPHFYEDAAIAFSSDSREKMAMRLSYRGRMTMSRNMSSVMRRTSSSPRMGMFLCVGDLVFISSGSMTPQNSLACTLGMMPVPLNSRSRGRKTACRKGRMVVKTTSHISTRCGMRRSSGMCRSVWSSEPKPV